MISQILLISAVLALAYGRCDQGWTQFENKCYFVSKGSINHPTAQAECTAKGGNLASIHSEQENNFVKSMLSNLMEQSGTGGTFHIGMMFSRSTPTGTGPVTSAVWMDGSPVDFGSPAEMGFQPGTGPWSDGKWHGGKAEPNGDGLGGQAVELCVVMPQNQEINGDWSDVNCASLAGMICNKKAAN